MPAPATAEITPADITQIAAKSYSDPRTVRRYLDGGELTSTRRTAIEAALESLGFGELVRPRVSA
jgi:hypothetical protein